MPKALKHLKPRQGTKDETLTLKRIMFTTHSHSKHPSSVLYFTRIRFDVAVVKSGASVHVNFVIIPEMGYKERDVPYDTALGASVRTRVRSEVTERLVL